MLKFSLLLIHYLHGNSAWILGWGVNLNSEYNIWIWAWWNLAHSMTFRMLLDNYLGNESTCYMVSWRCGKSMVVTLEVFFFFNFVKTHVGWCVLLLVAYHYHWLGHAILYAWNYYVIEVWGIWGRILVWCVLCITLLSSMNDMHMHIY